MPNELRQIVKKDYGMGVSTEETTMEANNGKTACNKARIKRICKMVTGVTGSYRN